MAENINILMVEDDTEIALLLSDYLENYGMNVDVCPDSHETIQKLDVKKYDLLVLDRWDSCCLCGCQTSARGRHS